MTPNSETKSRSIHFQIKYNQTFDIQIFQFYKVWNPSRKSWILGSFHMILIHFLEWFTKYHKPFFYRENLL